VGWGGSPDLAEMLGLSIQVFSFSILNMWLTWQVFIAETFLISTESKRLGYRDVVMDIYSSFL